MISSKLQMFSVCFVVLFFAAACGGDAPAVQDATVTAPSTPIPPPPPLETEPAVPTTTAVPIEAPATATPVPTSPPPPTITPSPTPDYPIYEGAAVPRNQIGIQIHLHGEDLNQIMGHLDATEVGWVKVQVSWKVFEPQPGQYDEFWFDEVTALIDAAEARDIQVMLSVAKAPEWSRPTTEMDGPPSDPADFGAFMTQLAGRYAGRVAAYELWNETNLQREWNGVPLSAADFVTVVRAGADAVRTIDPTAVIISGAPAPTGINDGVTAVDDRVYFEQALAAGLASAVDGFGVHPYGWGNPPDSRLADPDPVAGSHNNHRSFFFWETLHDYRDLLVAADVNPAEKKLWATEFGWGTTENFGQGPVAGAEFMNDVDEWQQAQYALRAWALAGERPWVGPLILWNLNFADTFGPDFSESAYSILRPDGSARPLYRSLPTLQDGSG